MHSELNAVTQLISVYFDGLYFSDIGRLATVFHPDAHYVCVTDGTLLQLSIPEYFAIVAKRESPASRNEVRKDRILLIEFAGQATAFCRLEGAIASIKKGNYKVAFFKFLRSFRV